MAPSSAPLILTSPRQIAADTAVGSWDRQHSFYSGTFMLLGRALPDHAVLIHVQDIELAVTIGEFQLDGAGQLRRP